MLSRRHQSEPTKQKITLTSPQVFIALNEKVGESKKNYTETIKVCIRYDQHPRRRHSSMP
jgi:hypothetical protein